MAESQIQASSIPVSWGGRITDPKLVEVLEKAPILQPQELLKLSIYFHTFPTNAHLGNVLLVSALKTIVRNQDIAPIIEKTYKVDIVELLDELKKTWSVVDEAVAVLFQVFHPQHLLPEVRSLRGSESEAVGRTDSVKVPSMDANLQTNEASDQSFLFVRVSDVNVLIEKRLLESGEAVFFVVGISPDPNELPDPKGPDNPDAPANASPK